MKLIVTISIFLVSSFVVPAQNLTGVWRGTFEQNSLDPIFGKYSKDTYKYEVQINQPEKGSIDGVTYSYLTTKFYGKAKLRGMFDKKNKTITIKETILVEVKATGKTDPCLMTCYLDYSKNGKLETLIGTYTSINLNKKSDCGNGTVFLERVPESDFEEEDFLKKNKTDITKKELGKNSIAGEGFPRKMSPNNANNPKKPDNAVTAKAKPVVKLPVEPAKPTVKVNKPLVKKENKPALNSTVKKKNTLPVKPGIKENIAKNDKHQPHEDCKDVPPPIKNTEIKTIEKPIVQPKKIPEPNDDVLVGRVNKLAGKFFVESKEITVEFYDNGEVDNDTISVYKDNQMVINRARLSTNPIRLTLKFDEVNTYYELITVAENLGDIPPNTALMMINYGKKRQEVFLTSDDRKNAKVIIEYRSNEITGTKH